jgi:membrane protease YdiL (CAAX protease family)
MSFYLGLSLDYGGERNLLTPIAIHALYDFVAFLAIVSNTRKNITNTND